MVKLIKSVPKNEGFYMPFEGDKHLGTWILWPERGDNWRENAKFAKIVFAEIANKIIDFEQVTVGVSDQEFENAEKVLDPRVKLIEISNNDSWIRDCGPTIIKNKQELRRAISWKFNAWGGDYDGLYKPWDKDDRVAKKVANVENLDYYQAPIILEGGSIHSDGDGTIYTTEECLLSKGRNPHLTKKEIEKHLLDYLGAEKIIWLPKGIYNDETNGHIDNIIQIVKPGTVLLAWTDDQNDPQYKISKAGYDILKKTRDAKNRKIKIIKLPIPNPPIRITKKEAEGVEKKSGTLPRNVGDRQAASYINFYLVNGAVIVPAFNLDSDKEALKIIQSAYPNRKIIPIKNAREIILGGGNIHCITQQIPE